MAKVVISIDKQTPHLREAARASGDVGEVQGFSLFDERLSIRFLRIGKHPIEDTIDVGHFHSGAILLMRRARGDSTTPEKNKAKEPVNGTKGCFPHSYLFLKHVIGKGFQILLQLRFFMILRNK